MPTPNNLVVHRQEGSFLAMLTNKFQFQPNPPRLSTKHFTKTRPTRSSTNGSIPVTSTETGLCNAQAHRAGMQNNVNVTADNSIPPARASGESGLMHHTLCRDNASYSLVMRRMECVSAQRLVVSERVYSMTWTTRTNALCSGFVATSDGPSTQGTSPLLAFNCETRWGLRKVPQQWVSGRC